MAQRFPEPGDVIGGKYAVEGMLGRGGMGAVFVVVHQGTGKRLALKCLLPEHHDDVDIEQRFMREAQAAGRIQHRHVVDVFDVGKEGDLLYMVMPILEGKPLSQLLQDEQLTLEETLGIMARAMEGVGAAHAHGIVHRDLKPDNIFVCVGPSGRLDDPRVLDFGISKRSDDISRPLTRSGVMMGTPYYMSFEQINSQRDLDQRVDVYAMGVILYEAIAGELPHRAESIGQLAIRMMGTPPAELAALRPDLPPGLSDVVMKAIARDREERYQSMHEFAEALKPYYMSRRSSLLPPDGGTPLHLAGRSSLVPNRGEDPTMPMRSPVPAPLRVTNPGAMSRSAPRMLRGGMGDHTPPRVIAPTSNRGLTIFLAALLGAGGAGAFWMYRSGESSREDKQAGEAPAVVARAPAVAPPGDRPLPAEQEPEGEAVDEARPSDAEKPKHRRKRRKVVRTTTEGGKQRQVVLFIDDPDAGEELVEEEEEQPAAEAIEAPTVEPAEGGEAKPSPETKPEGSEAKPPTEPKIPTEPKADGKSGNADGTVEATDKKDAAKPAP
jgi:serine/threonine protein kinase